MAKPLSQLSSRSKSNWRSWLSENNSTVGAAGPRHRISRLCCPEHGCAIISLWLQWWHANVLSHDSSLILGRTDLFCHVHCFFFVFCVCEGRQFACVCVCDLALTSLHRWWTLFPWDVTQVCHSCVRQRPKRKDTVNLAAVFKVAAWQAQSQSKSKPYSF